MKIYAPFKCPNLIIKPGASKGSAKPFGPSYPQAVSVNEGGSVDGLWTVYSINKEDIGVTFVPRKELIKIELR